MSLYVNKILFTLNNSKKIFISFFLGWSEGYFLLSNLANFLGRLDRNGQNPRKFQNKNNCGMNFLIPSRSEDNNFNKLIYKKGNLL